MALSPILVVGCGGSGGKTVLGLRRRLDEELRRRGWDRGIPAAWQMKWIDVPTIAEDHPNFGPALPLGDYVGLAATNDYQTIDRALVSTGTVDVLQRLIGWRPSPLLQTPVSKGAGQQRAVGRAVALAGAEKVREMVRKSFDAIKAGRPELLSLAKHLGIDDIDPKPVVFVVSSMAGGTGAGIFMDVCDLIRAQEPETDKQIFGFLYTAEIFKNIPADAGMVPNTAASLGELVSGFLNVDRPVEPLYGKVGTIAVEGRSGPNWPFVLGMQPMNGGAPLESPEQCYRAVTGTLLAAMINEEFFQRFVTYQITNFGPNSNASKRRTYFEMFNQPSHSGGEVYCGVLSSFGSAEVSVGTAKFGVWARDRLARAAIEHMTEGWKLQGRQLMGEAVNASTTDQDVINFLVGRERQQFIAKCGLWEENEPNGPEHNQVQDGILSMERFQPVQDGLRSGMHNQLRQGGKLPGSQWTDKIFQLLGVNQGVFKGDIEKAVTEGKEQFCSELVGKIGATVSSSLARFGIRVTQELVKELRAQCKTAIDQLRNEQQHYQNESQKDFRPFALEVFAPLKSNNCEANSDFVKSAVEKALYTPRMFAAVRRVQVSIEVLDLVVNRVIAPLLTQLSDIGGGLATEESVKEIQGWPDAGGDVSAAYAPSPSEMVLVHESEWNRHFQELLQLSVPERSVEAVRDQVATGGFQYGSLVSPKIAPVMIEFDDRTRWWDRDGGLVSVIHRLKPEQVADRAACWFQNSSHPAGKFVELGLEEYLSETGEERHKRLVKFEEALRKARDRAQPLVRIDSELMARVHIEADLTATVTCEPFPFPPAMEEARDIVTRVMYGERQRDGGWFMSGNTSKKESVLLTAVLDCAVQPAVVASLTDPIAQAWHGIQIQPPNLRQGAMRGFWTYNRARLLSESIPLPSPSIDNIIRGWFLGRLLGIVSNATETEPFRVQYLYQGLTRQADLPWPLLRHRDAPNLHLPSHQAEWLPALFEQMALATMMVGQWPNILDGYEQLFQLGVRSRDIIEEWLQAGTVKGLDISKAQVSGATLAERKASLSNGIQVLHGVYVKRSDTSLVVSDWERFVQIPYGRELFERITGALEGFATTVQAIQEEVPFG